MKVPAYLRAFAVGMRWAVLGACLSSRLQARPAKTSEALQSCLVQGSLRNRRSQAAGKEEGRLCSRDSSIPSVCLQVIPRG